MGLVELKVAELKLSF